MYLKLFTRSNNDDNYNKDNLFFHKLCYFEWVLHPFWARMTKLLMLSYRVTAPLVFTRPIYFIVVVDGQCEQTFTDELLYFVVNSVTFNFT